MEKVFVDTDVMIDFLRGYKPRIKNFFKRIENGGIKAYTSWINIVELYSGVDSEEKDPIISELLSILEIIGQDIKSTKLAGYIRRQYNLSLADSIIASLTIKNNLKLLTFNKKDFQKIKDLQLFPNLAVG